MNRSIKRVKDYLQDHPKVKQWLWFIVLWMGGLCAVVIGTYPIKMLIDLAS